MLYLAAPLILIPLWAYHEGNWLLLVGVAISEGATLVTARMATGSFGPLIGIVCAISWFVHGIHNYWTFFPLCGLWGFTLFLMAENVQQEYAMQSLIESPELFYEAIAQNKIMIVRRGDGPSTPEESVHESPTPGSGT